MKVQSESRSFKRWRSYESWRQILKVKKWRSQWNHKQNGR